MFKIAAHLAVAAAPLFVFQGCKDSEANDIVDRAEKAITELNQLAGKEHTGEQCQDILKKNKVESTKTTVHSQKMGAKVDSVSEKLKEALGGCIKSASDAENWTLLEK